MLRDFEEDEEVVTIFPFAQRGGPVHGATARQGIVAS